MTKFGLLCIFWKTLEFVTNYAKIILNNEEILFKIISSYA